MSRVLNIVETAYRATAEEQDDTSLWLTAMLRRSDMDIAVLLRANAVNYLVAGQDASGLRIGTRGTTRPPELDRDVAQLIEAGVDVFYVADDAADRGLDAGALLAGVQAVDRASVAELVSGFDKVWHW